jgi:hypothetical protein
MSCQRKVLLTCLLTSKVIYFRHIHGFNKTPDRQARRRRLVGTLGFAEKVKNELGFKAAHRDVIEIDGSYTLREPAGAYGLRFAAENEALRLQNTFFWNESFDEATT